MKSGFCKRADFDRYGATFRKLYGGRKGFDRKAWECITADEVFRETGRMKSGSTAIGFGVGTEFTPSLLAGWGVAVTATDQEPTAPSAAGWAATFQFMNGPFSNWRADLCDKDVYERLVTTRRVDMTAIPADLAAETFDLVWSLGSLEHLGTLEAADKFIFDSLACLKPGGRAFHTTEFAIYPNESVETGDTCFYDAGALGELVARLRKANFVIEVDWDMGTKPLDYWIDVPPYDLTRHLKLNSNGIVCTSLALVIDKPKRLKKVKT